MYWSEGIIFVHLSKSNLKSAALLLVIKEKINDIIFFYLNIEILEKKFQLRQKCIIMWNFPGGSVVKTPRF